MAFEEFSIFLGRMKADEFSDDLLFFTEIAEFFPKVFYERRAVGTDIQDRAAIAKGRGNIETLRLCFIHFSFNERICHFPGITLKIKEVSFSWIQFKGTQEVLGCVVNILYVQGIKNFLPLDMLLD
ncbi:MAG: hypothetical protein L0G95_14585 [Planococcus sp. (in: firmicutes)]|nr:hypothetical protein [Planococcus sp. (in: firmicutes)]